MLVSCWHACQREHIAAMQLMLSCLSCAVMWQCPAAIGTCQISGHSCELAKHSVAAGHHRSCAASIAALRARQHAPSAAGAKAHRQGHVAVPHGRGVAGCQGDCHGRQHVGHVVPADHSREEAHRPNGRHNLCTAAASQAAWLSRPHRARAGQRQLCRASSALDDRAGAGIVAQLRWALVSVITRYAYLQQS